MTRFFFFFLPFLITENATGNMYPPLYLILPAGTVCVPTSAVSHHLQFNVMYLPQLWTNRNTVTLLRLHQRRLWLCCIALQFITRREKKIKTYFIHDILWHPKQHLIKNHDTSLRLRWLKLILHVLKCFCNGLHSIGRVFVIMCPSSKFY